MIVKREMRSVVIVDEDVMRLLDGMQIGFANDDDSDDDEDEEVMKLEDDSDALLSFRCVFGDR